MTSLKTMQAKKQVYLTQKPLFKLSLLTCVMLGMPLVAHAEAEKSSSSFGDKLELLFKPQTNPDFNKVKFNELSQFTIDTSAIPELPVIRAANTATDPNATTAVQNAAFNAELEQQLRNSMPFNQVILTVLQRNPKVSQALADLAMQNANIDTSKAGYYPQLSGGLSTADLTKGEKGNQLINLNATQMLYDFGKIKSDVNTQEAGLLVEQANILVNIDEVALETVEAIVNIRRFQEISNIADQQIKGIGRIAEIANLRAQAGISSQADPIQAQSNLEAARANFISQNNQLRQFQQKLRTLVGFDVSNVQWELPDRLVKESQLYADVEFNQVPAMIVAQGQVQMAKMEKEKTRLSNYPTLNLKGSLSQAINGNNPNNNKDNGFYNSIMLEMTSNFYQGGATAARTRAASYAEEAAKSRMNTVYLEVLDEVRLLREEIDNKQKQMNALLSRQETAIRTKELYQEQYKLGTRTVVDLLNAEQSIHSAAQEIENARYDIYQAIVRYIAKTGRTRTVYDLNNVSIQGLEIQS